MLIYKSPFIQKIVIFMSLVVFIGYGALTFLTVSSVKAAFRRAHLSVIQGALYMYKMAISNWIGEKTKDIEALSKVFEHSSQIGHTFLRDYREISHHFADVIILDNKGNIVQTGRQQTIQTQINLSDREYFQEALKGSKYVSGFFRGRGVGVATLAISAPIKKDGKPDRVIAGFITLKKFLEVFDPARFSIAGSKDILTVSLINVKGHVISDPDYLDRYPKDPAIDDPAFRSSNPAVTFLLEKREGASLYLYNGRHIYGAYAWVEPLGVGLILEAEQETLEAPLNRLVLSVVLSSSLVFGILIAVIFFVISSINRHLYQLVLAMEGYIKEGSKSKVTIEKSGSPVDQVVDTFKELQEVVDQRETRLKDRASRDPLTGLYNHGMLEDLVHKEYHRRKRSGNPFCFLMIDIDHFKNINDNLGHAVGDHVLREVSRILESCVRSGDIVARYGGEEFAILVDSDQPVASQALAERVRSRIESHPFMVNGQKLPLTVSVGWVCLKTDSVPDSRAIVKEADDELYRAKEAGRNRVSGHSRV